MYKILFFLIHKKYMFSHFDLESSRIGQYNWFYMVGTSTIWVPKRNVSLKHCHFVTIQLGLEITHSLFTWILWQIHEKVVMLHPKYYWVGKIEQFWYSFSFFCCQIRNCLSFRIWGKRNNPEYQLIKKLFVNMKISWNNVWAISMFNFNS